MTSSNSITSSDIGERPGDGDALRLPTRELGRGRMVNRLSGEPSSQLHERRDASDFDTKTQDKLTVN